MNDHFKIAIISDMHCTHGGGQTLDVVNTYLTSDILPKPINKNPVESLKNLVSKHNLQADLLLCPGDITNKMNIAGLTRGWDFLQQLAITFKSRQLIATPGNHDVDSHSLLGKDKSSFDSLLRLSDNYPTSNPHLNDAFWSRNYCIVEDDDFLVLNINSCFNHTTPEKAKESVISPTTVEEIDNILESKKNSKFKIALFHHHPMLHSNMTYKDGDFIDKSDLLLKTLDKNNFDICVHGHKHDPRLQYRNGIAVFGAGAFSSTMNIMDIKADNTFHIVTLFKNQRKGLVESWIYSPKDGWKQKKDTYFPCFTGFGYRPNITILAKQINDWFKLQGKDLIKITDVLNTFPDLPFLIPDDQENMNNTLLQEHGIKFIPELGNNPQTLSILYK